MIGRCDFEKSPIEQHINTKLSELNVRYVENSRACQCEMYPPAVTAHDTDTDYWILLHDELNSMLG